MATDAPHIPYRPQRKSEMEMRARVQNDFDELNRRRSVRQFSSDPIPLDVVEQAIAQASSAPSGAHKQPWTFCLVTNPDLKQAIRQAAEREEQLNYSGRMSDEWLKDLAPLGTDAQKPFLEEAPALIVVFKQSYGLHNDTRSLHYYVNESVGIACGILIAALHRAGLCTLTHTPSPMNFLERLLQRPSNEKAYLLLPVGYAHSQCTVPQLQRKSPEAYLVRYA